MRRPIVALKVGLGILSLTCTYRSYGHASVRLTDALNLMLRLSDENANQGITQDDCQQLADFLSEAERDTNLSRFAPQAQKIFKNKCGASVEGDPLNSAPAAATDSAWDGVPQCGSQGGRVLFCEHNPKTGRGLFALGGTANPENSPTLVCAHFEASSRSPFDYLQEVTNRCVVTEFDWRYEGSRSDVLGMKTWLKSPVGSAALRMPAALRDQCSQVFPDAWYCTPTMIVLPEQDISRVTVCGLETRAQRFGFGPILHIGSANSRWTCESKNLMIPDKDERLSVEERSCVPDHLGRLMNDYCRLPYMPVLRSPVRTYIPQ